MDVVIDIASAPLDDYTMEDIGDASPVSSEIPLKLETGPPPPPPKALVIPFMREIKLNSTGRDVVGAKRAIWRANGLHVTDNLTPMFGQIAVDQLKAFQRKHNLAVDGVLGRETLKKLAPSFDQYAYLLYVGYPPGTSAVDRLRQGILAYALWGYNNRGPIYYVQFRPMTYMSDLKHLPIAEDCSTFSTKCYKWSGALDPNGMNYNGYGNTTSQLQHGHAPSTLKLGDLIFYSNPDHVGVYVGSQRVIELGNSTGPLLVPYNYRQVTGERSYLD